MKTMVKFCLMCSLLFCGLGYAAAQSAASSSRDVTPIDPNLPSGNAAQAHPAQQASYELPLSQIEGTPAEQAKNTRGIPMWNELERLVGSGKITEALAEFENFKKSQTKANKFDLQFLEMTIYREAVFTDPDNASQYEAKEKELVQQLTEQFPNVSDVILLQLTPESSNEEIINITTKAIEVDKTNAMAFEQRGRALHAIGKTKEACADFEHLPYKTSLPEYQWCQGAN